MTEQIPAEAVEAAARAALDAYLRNAPESVRQVCAWDAVDEQTRQSWRAVESAALAAVLPYLAQSARVAPSVEEVARTIDPDSWAVVETVPRERAPGVWDSCKVRQKASRAAAKSVVALLVAQPTVAEVRETVAREIESNSVQHMPWLRPHEVVAVLARIARSETKEADHD